MPIACPQCGSELADETASCPACALLESSELERPRASFADRLSGALAYFLALPALLFLLLPRWRKNPFVRFHSLQSIYVLLAAIVLAVAARVLALALIALPRYGQLSVFLLGIAFVIGLLVLWALLVFKALLGRAFQLPWVGRLAASQSGLA